ncbi:MAG: polymerase ECF-type sigma factor [Segetibacter sp.]|nr:polymerase ECF-type sigma factor [Segetibacter sp.]
MNLQPDEERFILILQEKKKIIYKICNSYCRSVEDRKDLAQEIIIQLWKSLHKYNEQYQLSTWVYAIALNVAMAFHRSKKRKREVFAGLEIVVAIMDDTTEEREQEENLQLLYKFINELEELNKALMILYLDNNSYKEISLVLGITETNVATKINRIKQKLKQQFNNALKS